MADATEEAKSLPLPDRFTHKLWKVRKEGYEDAAKSFQSAFDEDDACFTPFLLDPGLMKGAAADSNVAAQQEGLGALCMFLQKGPKEAAARSRGGTTPAIIEKGLPSTRAGVKQNALEALMLYVEALDKGDAIVEDFIPMFTHKQPKVIAAALGALTALYHAYGVRIIDPKSVLKTIPKPFAHADKNVRAEATKLAVELYRWLQDAMKKPFWTELKELQQKELEAEFDKIKSEPPPQQERLTRRQQAAAAAAEGIDEAPEAQAEEEPVDMDDFEDDDSWENAPQTDVLAKMPGNFTERMASSKWKDRKEALDELHVIANVTRIKEGPYDELLGILAKSMKDANIMVVIVAANVVEDMAKGLQRGFTKYRGRIMSPMFERLKEKKQTVADALGAALDAVFQATSLGECLEEIVEFLKHKNPQVKLETMKFLIRCLQTTREAPGQPEVKSIADAANKLMTESVETLRSGGAEAMGTLMKIMGEDIVSAFMNGLDDIRKAKVLEFRDAAEVKAKHRPKPKAKPAPAARAAPPGRKAAPVAKKTVAAPAVKKPAPKPLSPEPAPAPSPAKSAARPGLGSKLSAPGGVKSGVAPPASSKLGFQKKLAGPGSMSGLASPQRKISPQMQLDEQSAPEQRLSATPRLGLGRGLAGRSLSKPASGLGAPVAAPPAGPAPPSGPSAADLQEMDDLRAEKRRLEATVEEMRKEREQVEAQLTDVRNHEAELIEERTHDRLTIKAKETQLLRARSDAEIAEETVRRQEREIDRLKRELVRAARGDPIVSPSSAKNKSAATEQAHMQPPQQHQSRSEHVFRDGGPGSPSSHASSSGSVGIMPRDVDRYESNRQSREIGYQRARNYMTSPSEEKENGVAYGVGATKGGRGLASPTAYDAGDGADATGAGGQPIESWRRAAEVTSALKQRIEQMKARQGIGRPH